MTLDLDTLVLKTSSHRSFEDGACLLEAASYLAGEPWSDHPTCVSPVLGAYGRGLNDALPDDKRQALVPLLPGLLNTADDGHDETRSLIALDWLIRTYLPTWLRLVPALVADADLLVAHHRIDSLEAAASIGDLVRAAASHSRSAAWSAAESAAWGAAESAARSAAWSAAWSAAESAAWGAAWSAAESAAWGAARSAAWGAAWSALAPTVDGLQDSAIALFPSLIAGSWS